MKFLTLSLSTVPVDIGVNVSGVHGMVADTRGSTYAFVAPKNKSREPVNEHFYDPKNKITRELLARFNDINPDKLRMGTFTSPSNPLAVVDNKCTIAAMIRLNSVSLGVDLNELPQEGNEGWFAIDRRVVDACMARYDEEKNLGFHDMRNLELSLTRIDSPKKWAEPAGGTLSKWFERLADLSSSQVSATTLPVATRPICSTRTMLV